MAVDRQLPTSASVDPVTGNAYMDAVSEEVLALWNYVRIPLTGVAGTANIITASLTPALVSGLADGMSFLLTPIALNTGPTSIEINGAAAVPICDMSGVALNGGETIIGRLLELIYDGAGSKFRVHFTPLNGVATQSADANFTLTVGSSKRDLRVTATQTAIRSATLSTAGASDGDDFVISRSGTGAFDLNIGPGVKNLATGTWGRFVYDGTAAAWYCAQTGSL